MSAPKPCNHLLANASFPKFVKKLYDGATPEPNSGCWLWEGPLLHKAGYGYIYVAGTRIQTHRLSYLAAHGEIPDGLFVLHKCDQSTCINPDHLYVGTAKQNIHDVIVRGRGRGNIGAIVGLEDEIRRLYVFGSREFGTRALGRMFGVSNITIYFALRRKAVVPRQNAPYEAPAPTSASTRS